MPIDRDRYSDDWEQIAHQVKSDANWCCEGCGRHCRKPGESLPAFIDRMIPAFVSKQHWDLYAEIVDKPARFILTTAHLDQNPANNDRKNLKALCSICHLNHDRPYYNHNRMRKREHRGQLTLEITV